MNVRAPALPGLADAWRSGTAIALGLGLLVLGLVFRTEVVTAVAVWDNSTAYNHCFLIIPIVLYLIWDRREALLEVPANPCPVAALAGIPLALAWLAAERLAIMEGRQLIAMTFVELLLFAVLGPRLWWRLAGPLLYLYFLVPFGAFLTPALQDVTTVFVREGLPFLHIPAFIDGYVIEIPEGTFLIAEACAGLRFLVAAVAFGCLYALIMYRSPLRRVAFIVISIIVPIVANGFRALGIVALGHYLGSAQAAEADHVLYGWIFFSIVILMLIVLGLPFREDHQPRRTVVTRPVRQPASSMAALIGATALVLLAEIGPALAAQLDRAAAPDVALVLPTLAAAEGCTTRPAPLTAGLNAPGRMIVQRFACAEGMVTLNIEVFSPRATASRVIAEQRRLTGEQGADDVEVRPLQVANSPSGSWRLIQTTNPMHVSATSLWIDGRQGQRGLLARARQGLNSIVGSRFSPVLVVVVAETNVPGLGLPGLRQAANTIAAFLESQPELSQLAARLAGSVAVSD